MTAIRLGIVGATGKMGQAVMKHATDDPHFIVCSTICSAHSNKLGQMSHPQLTYKDFCDQDVDVVIDFSTREGTCQATRLKKPLVCGTTDLSEKEFELLNNLSKKVPVLYSPNFSLGMALCFSLLEQMGSKVKNFSRIAISEKHNKGKKDAPSGSALHMAKLLNIPKNQIVCERLDQTIFYHQIEFFLNKEKVVIQHEAFSRENFAMGALSAAKFLFNKPAGMYGLKDLWS